jgi:hypothetical protein
MKPKGSPGATAPRLGLKGAKVDQNPPRWPTATTHPKRRARAVGNLRRTSGQRKAGHLRKMGISLTSVSGNEGLRASSADFAFGGLAHGGCGLGRVCTEGAEGGGLGGHRGTICPCPSEMNGPQSKGHSNMRVEGENWCHGVDFGPKPVPRQCPDHVKKDVFSPFLRKMSAKLRRAAAIWRSACGGMTYESKSCLIPLEFVFFGAVQAPFRTLDAPPHALPTTR